MTRSWHSTDAAFKKGGFRAGIANSYREAPISPFVIQETR